MWRTSLFIAITLLFHFPDIGLSQTENPSKYGLHVSGGGVAPYYSINFFHQIFTGEKIRGYLNLGGSVWGGGVAFPTAISLITGNGSHHPEFIFSITPVSEGVRFWNRDNSDLLLDVVLGVGYRYQPVAKSFFISGGLFPYLRLDPTTSELSEKKVILRIRPGISIGWYI